MAIAVAAGKAPPTTRPAALRRGVGNALRPPEPHPSSRQPNLRIGEPNAKEMERVGVVREAAPITSEGRRVPFATVEGKPAWLRRRSIALPKGKNDHGDCEAEAPLRRPVRALFSLKAVRRGSQNQRGLLQLNGGAGLPGHEDRQGKGWLWPLLGSKPVHPEASTHIGHIGDRRSMYECGAPCLRIAGRFVWLAARGNKTTLHLIRRGACRALAPSSFAEATPKNLHNCINAKRR
ncbi:hypothetical protein ERJ75_001254200 [Trypanosoma vivax]|nr:hypothetical protein ERJ75_001254200 [Trypanosoma vivax]